MDLARIRELIKVASESDAAEVEIEEHGVRIVVRKNAPSMVLQPPLMVAQYPQTMMPAGTYAPPAALPPTPAPAVPALQEPVKETGVIVEAPTPGTYYSAPAPDVEAFVSIGDAVKVGDTLCIIEAMKLMNEIECEVAGTISKILVKDAEPVEYGQALFAIEPA